MMRIIFRSCTTKQIEEVRKSTYDVQHSIKDWLKFATERDGKRKEKEAARMEKSVL